MEAIKGKRTLIELAEQFQIHPNQITKWKKQLLENAEEVFAKEKKTEEGPSVKEFQAKIGQLAMENDFLAVALGRILETDMEHSEKHWIYAMKTLYVYGGDAVGPHGGVIIPFSEVKFADDYVKEHGGRIVMFDDVTMDMLKVGSNFMPS